MAVALDPTLREQRVIIQAQVHALGRGIVLPLFFITQNCRACTVILGQIDEDLTLGLGR